MSTRPRKLPAERVRSDGVEDEAAARSLCLRALARREHSAKELLELLRRKGFSSTVATQAVAFAQGHGFQDDERFSQSRSRWRSARFGNSRIRAELHAKGVDPQLAAASLNELESELSRARLLAEKFEGQAPDARLRCRLWRYLTGRGFEADTVAQVWKELCLGSAEDADV